MVNEPVNLRVGECGSAEVSALRVANEEMKALAVSLPRQQ